MAFSPLGSIQISASEASTGAWLSADCPLVLVTNFGPGAVYLRFGTGDGTIAETQHDVPVLPMSQLLLVKGVGADAVAVVCDEGKTASVYLTVGTGS